MLCNMTQFEIKGVQVGRYKPASSHEVGYADSAMQPADGNLVGGLCRSMGIGLRWVRTDRLHPLSPASSLFADTADCEP